MLLSCKKDKDGIGRLAPAIMKTAGDLHITGLSYLICNHDRILYSRFADDGLKLDPNAYNDIITNFSGPVLLNRMMKDNQINAGTGLEKIVPSLKPDSLTVSDLVFIKADRISPFFDSIPLMNSTIRSTIASVGTKNGDLLDKFTRATLKLEKKQDLRSLFENAFLVSNYFDDAFTEYSYRDTAIQNLSPTWYTRNIVGFFGWNVFKFHRETLLWKSFTVSGKSVLIFKSPDRDLFISIAYDKIDVLETDFLHKKDLLQSPMALVILKYLFLPGKVGDIDYDQGEGGLTSAFTRVKNLEGYIFLTRELLAYARFEQKYGSIRKADKLYGIYKRSLDNSPLTAYVNKSPLAEINYVPDNLDAVIPFNITADTVVRFFGAGQVITKDDYITSPENYDHIQIYLNKNVPPDEISYEDLRLFQYNYGLKTVSGIKDRQFPDSSLLDPGIKFAFSDPNDTCYTLEARIPWKSVYGRSLRKKSLGANIFIGDSDLDENYRKSMVSWVVKSDEYWNDASKYGQIMFSEKGKAGDPRKNYCIRSNAAPLIDGVMDKIWEMADFSTVNTPYIGKASAFDSSARFKTLYDNEYIYFFVQVTDNCKNPAGITTKDKCWITDPRTGEIIWKMSAPASKGMPSFFVDNSIHLKKGKYQLHYRSDKGSSFEGFYGPNPIYGFYGAQIYLL